MKFIAYSFLLFLLGIFTQLAFDYFDLSFWTRHLIASIMVSILIIYNNSN
jgi:hypothetical protein